MVITSQIYPAMLGVKPQTRAPNCENTSASFTHWAESSYSFLPRTAFRSWPDSTSANHWFSLLQYYEELHFITLVFTVICKLTKGDPLFTQPADICKRERHGVHPSLGAGYKRIKRVLTGFTQVNPLSEEGHSWAWNNLSPDKSSKRQYRTYFQDCPLFHNNSVIALCGFAIFCGNSFKDEYSICQAIEGVWKEQQQKLVWGVSELSVAEVLQTARIFTAFINNPNQNIFSEC